MFISGSSRGPRVKSHCHQELTMKLHHWTILLALALVTPASGRIIRGVAAGGMVQLPYSVSDAGGNQWMIYPGGWCQMQGNNPIFSQGAMIMINGGQPQVRNN